MQWSGITEQFIPVAYKQIMQKPLSVKHFKTPFCNNSGFCFGDVTIPRPYSCYSTMTSSRIIPVWVYIWGFIVSMASIRVDLS